MTSVTPAPATRLAATAACGAFAVTRGMLFGTRDVFLARLHFAVVQVVALIGFDWPAPQCEYRQQAGHVEKDGNATFHGIIFKFLDV
jgi:hypothetical protein